MSPVYKAVCTFLPHYAVSEALYSVIVKDMGFNSVEVMNSNDKLKKSKGLDKVQGRI